MRSRALFIVVGVLTLAALACGPLETPTLEPGVLETAVAQTVQAQLATEATEAEVKPTDTSSPTATDTPPPTATDTPTPSPPPATDTPAPTDTPYAPANTPTVRPTPAPTPCAIAIAPEFEPRLNTRPDILLALGCPASERLETWGVEVRFQHGRMFWQQDTDVIYILYDGTGTFQLEPDQFVEGDPNDACPEVGGAPAGLVKPVRGFNWHWCNTAGVRSGLGWALEEETGYNVVWQPFEHGYALQSRANHNFVFYDDGTWDYVE